MKRQKAMYQMKEQHKSPENQLNEGEIGKIPEKEFRMTVKNNKEKRMKRNEDSLRDLCNNIKRNNIHIIGVSEGEEREKDKRKYLKRL